MNDSVNNPLVSIIVRTKDRPQLLQTALKSVSEQTYRPIEVVLVNDGGCDLDTDSLKDILHDISLNYIQFEKNKGRSCAGNVGIENAKGTYSGFLDDDDILYPDHIETLSAGLRTNNQYPVCYVDSYLAFHEFDKLINQYILKTKDRFYSEDFDRDRFLFENYIPFLCLMFRTDLLIQYRFEEDLHTHEDWRLLALIARKHDFLHIKKITCQYNILGDSFTDYLETRYNIQESARVVFERNKEFMNWNAWMSFKNKLDDRIREYSVLNKHLKNEIEKNKSAIDLYTRIQHTNDTLTEHLKSHDNQVILQNKLDHVIENTDNFNNLFDKIVTEMDAMKTILHGISATQSVVMNRLSVTERIKRRIDQLRKIFLPGR